MSDRRDDRDQYQSERGDPERERRFERRTEEAPRDLGDRRFRDTGQDVRKYADFERDQEEHGHRGDDIRRVGEVIDREGRHRHYSLAGLHDLGDLSELRERYHAHRDPRDSSRRAPEEDREQRAKDPEPTSTQPPGDPSLHS